MGEIKYIAFLLMCSLCILTIHADIQHNIQFELDKFIFGDDTINNITYRTIDYDNLFCSGEPGEPRLPYKTYSFSIPYNATNVRLITSARTSIINNVGTIVPIQQPVATQENGTVGITLPDSVIYNTNNYYPNKFADITFDGYIYGDNRIITVTLHPALYNPVSQSILVANKVNLMIYYTLGDSAVYTIGSVPISRKNVELRNKEIQEVQSIVENPNNTSIFHAPARYSNPSMNQDTIPSYNYIVITNRVLSPAFKKIIALKRQKGYSAGVVCVEDILASTSFSQGDIFEAYPTFAINDSAGCVRQYLKYAYGSQNNPAQYVLLGGIAPYCPVRKGGGTGSSLYDENFSEQGKNKPTDMYFSNLTTPWRRSSTQDYGHYSDFGQYHNSSIFFPEVFVGRLLCRNTQEINNYSSKLEKYTLLRNMDDFSYLKKSVFTQQNGMQTYHEADSCAKTIQDELQFSAKIIQVVNNTNPTGAQIINDINNNKYGYMSFHGHGSPVSILVNNNGYKLTMLDSFYSSIQGGKQEVGNGFDCLINKNWPNVAYSIACSTMPYDIYTESSINLVYDFGLNIGQSLTLMKDYGAVAFLSNTRLGLMSSDPKIWDSTTLERFFINNISLHKQIGAAEGFSKYQLAKNYNKSQFHINMVHNLLGDPETEMWTDIPQSYSGITVNRSSIGAIVSGITPQDTIGYCDNNGIHGRLYGNTGSVSINYPNCMIMVYKHNYIPYIAHMVLENCDIEESQYVYASSFDITNNVNFKNDACYEIDATGDVFIGSGAKVEDGAELFIKTPGKVTIDGCVFQSGAKVIIEAGKIEIIKSFNAECGAKVEIKNYIEQ